MAICQMYLLIVCSAMHNPDLQVPIASAQFCHDTLAPLSRSVRLKKYPGDTLLKDLTGQPQYLIQGLGHDTNSALQHDLQMFVSSLLCYQDDIQVS